MLARYQSFPPSDDATSLPFLGGLRVSTKCWSVPGFLVSLSPTLPQVISGLTAGLPSICATRSPKVRREAQRWHSCSFGALKARGLKSCNVVTYVWAAAAQGVSKGTCEELGGRAVKVWSRGRSGGEEKGTGRTLPYRRGAWQCKQRNPFSPEWKMKCVKAEKYCWLD